MAETAVVVEIASDRQVASWFGERSNVGLVGLQLANLIGDGSPAALDLNKTDVGIASGLSNSADAFFVTTRLAKSNLRKRFHW